MTEEKKKTFAEELRETAKAAMFKKEERDKRTVAQLVTELRGLCLSAAQAGSRTLVIDKSLTWLTPGIQKNILENWTALKHAVEVELYLKIEYTMKRSHVFSNKDEMVHQPDDGFKLTISW